MGLGWLEEHLETFVRPHLGTVPTEWPGPKVMYGQHNNQWSDYRIKALMALWAVAKKRSEGRPILLAGRDVWLFEVLARIEDVPTTFRPEISSTVAKASPKAITENYKEYYLLDTGYRGSVPVALGITHFDLISFDPVVYPPLPLEERLAERLKHQVFPNAQLGRLLPNGKHQKAGKMSGMAGLLESTPKYWTRGTITICGGGGWQISQKLNTTAEFTATALLTQMIARAGRFPLKLPRIRRTYSKTPKGWVWA